MKKILFGLMSLMIGICLISASYAISQENDAVGVYIASRWITYNA